jgi:hypothetical protein
MTSRSKRPRSVRSLSRQLKRIVPDPKGDRLRSKIAACGVEEHVTWELMTREMLDWCKQNARPPEIAEHVVRVTTYDEGRKLILIYYDPRSGHPTRFMLVPHPRES